MDLKGVSLFLVGMMGSGKTTVGRLLAADLGYQFFDTDTLIEQLAGQTVTEIFATAGEAEFRRLETQVLAELSAYKQLVVATGGGIVLQLQNWSYLRHGLVIWLDAPVQTLYERLQGDRSRPLLVAPDPLLKLQDLLIHRQPLYAQADVRVPIMERDRPDQVAAQVLIEIPKVLKPEKISAPGSPQN
jgi:shikimate kinase